MMGLAIPAAVFAAIGLIWFFDGYPWAGSPDEAYHKILRLLPWRLDEKKAYLTCLVGGRKYRVLPDARDPELVGQNGIVLEIDGEQKRIESWRLYRLASSIHSRLAKEKTLKECNELIEIFQEERRDG